MEMGWAQEIAPQSHRGRRELGRFNNLQVVLNDSEGPSLLIPMYFQVSLKK